MSANKISTFSDSYVDHFVNSGYESIPCVPVSWWLDSSTVFIWSTISVFKGRIDQLMRYDKWLILSQPSIRTQNKVRLYDEWWLPEYGSFFHLVGWISKFINIQDLCRVIIDVFNFLNKQPWIANNKNIVIKVASRDIYFIRAISWFLGNLGITMEIDTMPISYYEWKYWMWWIHWHGITFAIRDLVDTNTQKEDIGNIIVMENEKDSPIAIQWWFWIETTLSRFTKEKSPTKSSLLAHFFEEYENYIWFLGFLDAVWVIIHLLSEWLILDNSWPWSHLKWYLRYCVWFCYKNNINLNLIIPKLEAYCRSYGYNNYRDILASFERLYLKIYSNIDNFSKYISLSQNLKKVREILQSWSEERILKLSSEFGLPREVLKWILESNLIWEIEQ